MATARRLVVVGASAGGLPVLKTLLGGLEPTLPACICVVVHQPEGRTSALADILDRAGPLPAALAEDGEVVRMGHVLVARAGLHLLCDGPRLCLSQGPREHGVRPAVDPLFRTAAASFGPSAVAVVLSGTLNDGSQGAQAVRLAGGAVIVQDPADAAYPDMPSHAIGAVGVHDIDAMAAAVQLPAAVTKIVDHLTDVVHPDTGTVPDARASGLHGGSAVRRHRTPSEQVGAATVRIPSSEHDDLTAGEGDA